ncbi:PREDICTED: lipase member M-like [Gekko japonicus]|uniref:Lipase n=1 Tax=Gekko japonicus TaxID=146911 RepID=A0ABM1KQX7_GEKJA|nr:PREDICTED: lipase member M-like [Gekko japonicus]XP_015276114.1 PREDICTED: lipase member M-like [Gekko japonicus]
MLLILFAMCCLYATMDVQGIPQDGKNKPRTLMNTKELILYHGYPCEEHDVVTQDDYILSIFRIPYGREENASTNSKPAVLLQHGMFGEASNWIASGSSNSLGFVLADNGCDVWLGSSRGSQWSKKHVSLSTEDENFWAFSFDHMAQYDLPATVDFILQKTGQQQLFYVGHSQGSTIGFIAFSTMPHLARKIKINFALAPVVSVKHAISPLKKLFTLPDFLYKIILGTKEFNWRRPVSRDKSGFCSFFEYSNICSNIIYNLFWSAQKALNMSQVDGYEVNRLVGTSVQNLIHWSQVMKSGKLQAYDYGTLKNLERYEKTHPPEYNVTNMNVSTAVWNVGNDGLADPEDIALLLPQITNLTYHKFIPEWDHESFIYGLDAYVQLHREILNMIKGSY